MAGLFGGHILNVGCKEDPAELGATFGAINCDINEYDPQSELSLYTVPNFQVEDACNLSFGDKSFDLVVLGEFLEHCPEPAARLALTEASRVLTSNGHIVLTIPYDSRPKEVQHAKHLLVTWKHGITSWHQTVWMDDKLLPLLNSLGLREITSHRKNLNYGFCQGVGIVVEKKRSED
jgi:SAM-dependent methyltransferase